MRYSQPFGTPAPPLGTYPRFINGDPVTGTEGSIPPATAIDEGQIEIVTVIQNAGITPDHGDLTQLWQAIQSLLQKLYITTPITKTVHGVGADFPDLISAFNWLGNYQITPTGFVTFIVAPGKWTYSRTVELNHANLSRVAIQGGALLGASPQPSNFSISGYHNASDGNNHIIYLRSVYATELSFTGGVNGFLVLRPGITLRYLLITGSQTIGPPTPPYGGGNGFFVLADIWIDGIAIWGFGAQGILIESGASVRCASSLSITISFCQNGIIGYGGNFWTYSGTQYQNIVSNSTSAVTSYGGVYDFGKLYAAGHGPPNGNAAIQVLQGGLLVGNPGSQCQVNYAGMIVVGAATVIFEYCLLNNNATYGLYTYGTSTVFINYSNMYANGQYDVIASEAAMVDATGVGMGTGWTPPFNTYDVAAGAYILH